MTEQADLKTWAIVEVMGQNEYAGFVSSENAASAAMLRVDVPETSKRPAFTKYPSASAIYRILALLGGDGAGAGRVAAIDPIRLLER